MFQVVVCYSKHYFGHHLKVL